MSPIMAIARVYPAMEKKLKELRAETEFKQVVEIYHENDKETSMSVFRPLTKEQEFQLWYEPSNYSRVEPKKTQ